MVMFIKWPKMYTKLYQVHFFVCLNWAFCSYFQSNFFYIYKRSSLLPSIHACTCNFGINVIDCLGFWVKMRWLIIRDLTGCQYFIKFKENKDIWYVCADKLYNTFSTHMISECIGFHYITLCFVRKVWIKLRLVWFQFCTWSQFILKSLFTLCQWHLFMQFFSHYLQKGLIETTIQSNIHCIRTHSSQYI